MGQCVCKPRRRGPAAAGPLTREPPQPSDQVDLELKGAVLPDQSPLASEDAVPYLCVSSIQSIHTTDEGYGSEGYGSEGYGSLDEGCGCTTPTNTTTTRPPGILKSKPRKVQRCRRVTFATEVQVRVFEREVQVFERETLRRSTEPPGPSKPRTFNWGDVLAELYGPPLATPPNG